MDMKRQFKSQHGGYTVVNWLQKDILNCMALIYLPINNALYHQNTLYTTHSCDKQEETEYKYGTTQYTEVFFIIL